MSILDQVESLRKQAIDLLLAERNLIDEKLVAFGHGEGIKNGRKKSCSRCGVEGHSIRTCPTPESTTV